MYLVILLSFTGCSNSITSECIVQTTGVVGYSRKKCSVTGLWCKCITSKLGSPILYSCPFFIITWLPSGPLTWVLSSPILNPGGSCGLQVEIPKSLAFFSISPPTLEQMVTL